MTHILWRALGFGLLWLGLLTANGQTPRTPRWVELPPSQPAAGPMHLPVILNRRGPVGFRALAFTRTLGYRHDSIPDGLALLDTLGAAHDFAVDATEDPATFSDVGLAPYQVVIFLLTTGDVLADDQQTALERFVTGGGGFVGIHSAADTEHGWPWYGDLIGARFVNHPPGTAAATLHVETHAHPSTVHLSDLWIRADEWYNFDRNPRPDVTVLLTIDETTYSGGTLGADHPMSWIHVIGAGRVWYTALGHTRESYAEPAFQTHVLGGIQWAANAP